MEQDKKQKLVITTKDGQAMRIPPEGALGLLALGYKGLIAWRQSRRQYMQAMKKQSAENSPPIETDPAIVDPDIDIPQS